MIPTSLPQIIRLIGVHDADGTRRGELACWIGARLGRTHCALCEITHGLVREHADWRSCRDELAVPFVVCHRDDQPSAVRAATDGVTPVIVAETSHGIVPLLFPGDLAACDGSPDRLINAIQGAVSAHRLAWSEVPTPGALGRPVRKRRTSGMISS